VNGDLARSDLELPDGRYLIAFSRIGALRAPGGSKPKGGDA
jgi:hypothetical protein